MFKLIEKFFRGFVNQTPIKWQSEDQESDIFRRFGDKWIKQIDCDDGWLNLINDCHEKLSSIDPNYTIFQIKQKFGTLRYYAEPSQEKFIHDFRAIISEHERLSGQICEMSGAEGVLMNKGGYYKTLDPALGKSLGYKKAINRIAPRTSK